MQNLFWIAGRRILGEAKDRPVSSAKKNFGLPDEES